MLVLHKICITKHETTNFTALFFVSLQDVTVNLGMLQLFGGSFSSVDNFLFQIVEHLGKESEVINQVTVVLIVFNAGLEIGGRACFKSS